MSQEQVTGILLMTQRRDMLVAAPFSLHLNSTVEFFNTTVKIKFTLRFGN